MVAVNRNVGANAGSQSAKGGMDWRILAKRYAVCYKKTSRHKFLRCQKLATVGNRWQRLAKVAAVGVEPTAATPISYNELGKSTTPCGAESGATEAQTAQLYPDLALIVNRWPTLPEEIRQRLVAMVQANSSKPGKPIS